MVVEGRHLEDAFAVGELEVADLNDIGERLDDEDDAEGEQHQRHIEGEGQEDGTLSLNIPADTAKALAGKTFVTMILE